MKRKAICILMGAAILAACTTQKSDPAAAVPVASTENTIIEPIPEDDLHMPRTDSFVNAETADAEAAALYADISASGQDWEPEIVEIVSFDLIALCAFTEAGNQPEDGIRAVVDVIRNRVEHPEYPNTAEAVIMQPYQFALGKHTVPEWFKEIVFDEWITEMPVLESDYVYFNTTPHRFGHDYIQIGAHWFGRY